jgi:hypothetical protein
MVDSPEYVIVVESVDIEPDNVAEDRDRDRRLDPPRLSPVVTAAKEELEPICAEDKSADAEQHFAKHLR